MAFRILRDSGSSPSAKVGVTITGPLAWALGQLASSSPFGKFSSLAQRVGESPLEPPPDVESLDAFQHMVVLSNQCTWGGWAADSCGLGVLE